MSVTRIASRYAKSLLELAQEQNKLERILEDVNSFSEVVKNRDFYLLLKSPIVHSDKKLSIMNALFSGKYDEMTMAFLRILVNKNREEYLPEMAAEFIHQYRDMKGISTVKVTTAQALSQDAIEAIRKKVLASNVTMGTIEVVTVVDPEVIGGFVLEFDDKLYDASVAKKLELMRKEFSGHNPFVSKVVKK